MTAASPDTDKSTCPDCGATSHPHESADDGTCIMCLPIVAVLEGDDHEIVTYGKELFADIASVGFAVNQLGALAAELREAIESLWCDPDPKRSVGWGPYTLRAKVAS